MIQLVCTAIFAFRHETSVLDPMSGCVISDMTQNLGPVGNIYLSSHTFPSTLRGSGTDFEFMDAIINGTNLDKSIAMNTDTISANT